MKKKKYQRPELDVIYIESSPLMEIWSIPIDDDDPGIGPGQEDEIGAKQVGFSDEEWDNTVDFKPWSK